jgi:hypothetical protein
VTPNWTNTIVLWAIRILASQQKKLLLSGSGWTANSMIQTENTPECTCSKYILLYMHYLVGTVIVTVVVIVVVIRSALSRKTLQNSQYTKCTNEFQLQEKRSK